MHTHCWRSAFLKTLWERVGFWRNAVRAKTAAKKTAPNSKRLPNGALRGSVAFFGLLPVSAELNTT